MALHITPAMVEAAYNLLKETPPFRAWKLPNSDDVEFRIIKSKTWYADHQITADRRHIFRVSLPNVETLPTLIRVMAHEMVHMRQALIRATDTHGASFIRMRDQVCRVHGFEKGSF